MKTTITILSIFLLINLSYSQNVIIKGHITNSKDSTEILFARVDLLKDNKIIAFTQTDAKGFFSINELPFGIYKIRISCLEYGNKLIDSVVVKANNDFMEIRYPYPCQYESENSIKGICLKGHIDEVIPIIYGLPGSDILKKAEEGKVKLGGCIIRECIPHWYCKKHDIEF